MTVQTEFLSRVERILGKPSGSVLAGTALQDLGVDSFALVEMLVRLQEELKTRVFQEDLAGITTIGDLEQVFARRHDEQNLSS